MLAATLTSFVLTCCVILASSRSAVTLFNQHLVAIIVVLGGRGPIMETNIGKAEQSMTLVM